MQEQASTTADAPGPRGARLPRLPAGLAGDLRGGLVSALVGLPYSISSGMLAFAPLGPACIQLGIAAGLLSSTVAGLVNALAGGTTCQISGPRASVAVLMAGLITSVMAAPAFSGPSGPDVGRVLGLVMLLTGLAGLAQVAFGLLRLGSWDRYLPYPVVAGFMVGLGILVAWPQVPALLGHLGPDGWRAMLRAQNLHPGDLLVGLATVLTMAQGHRLARRVPAPVLAVAAGTAVYYLILPALGSEALGSVAASTLPAGAQPLMPWEAPRLVLDQATLGLVLALLPAVLTLAFVGSLESLLSSSVLDIVSNARHDSDRELLGQGLSNLAIAALGGAVSAGAPFRGVTNWNAGGRGPASIAIHGLVLGLMGLAAMDFILLVPLAVWAGVLLMVGWTVMNTWRARLVGCPREDVVVGALVALVTLSLGSVAAMVTGMAGAAVLYVKNTSRAPIRASWDGRTRRSLRVRTGARAQQLQAAGAAVVGVELQGSLFFGTAYRCASGIESLAEGARYVILDLRRVSEVDPTGALVLAQVARRLAAGQRQVLLASVSREGRRGQALERAGVGAVVAAPYWFRDADAALEWTENRLLEEAGQAVPDDAELPLAELEVCAGMHPALVSRLADFLDRDVLPAGSVLFRHGDDGERLFLLVRGTVSVRVNLARKEGRVRRLATYGPGVCLGEMAVLEGKRRSAEALCEEESVLYTLSRADLARMAGADPELHGLLMQSLARQLAGRLRTTTEQLRSALD